jgi:hypothetical protein
MRGKVEVYIKREEVVVGQTVIGRPIMGHWCTAKNTLKTEKVMPEDDRIALEIVKEVAKERDVRVDVIDTSSFRGMLKAKSAGVNKTPTIVIGKNKIEGVPEKGQILKLLYDTT